jgi:hypothetical protein
MNEMRRTPHSKEKEAVSGHEEAAIRRELDRILGSPQFRGSKRCSRFLAYSVGQTLAGGHEAELKERAIAAEVFDRSAGYDPNDDAIVRVTASEVRKRLAQSYLDSGNESPVRIDLPLGSYSAQFHWETTFGQQTVPPEDVLPSAPLRSSRRWRTAVVLTAVIATSFLAGWQMRSLPSAPPGILREFWAPFTQGTSPVLMCVGTPVVYDFSSRLRNAYLQTLPPEARVKPIAIPMAPDQKVAGADLVAQSNTYAGFGNVHAAAELVALFSRLSAPWQVRTAGDVSFAELRMSPAILIGSESNVWTEPLTAELRFYFARENRTVIRDRLRPGEQWPRSDADGGAITEDFAVVSRIIDSKTGHCLMFLGGRTQFGTQAAGELVTHASELNSALKAAPRGWAGKNLQLVIRTRIHGSTPSAPEVVVSHFW